MARALTDTLRDLRGGMFIDEATDALSDLVNAVSESGKPGKITIELTLKRASRGAGALVISDKVIVKKPAEEPAETMMFATPEGSLLVNDPRQSKLDLRKVDFETGELKVAAEG